MANVTEIINNFRFDCNVDEWQVSDEKALNLLNRVYREFINDIRSINEDYFYDYWFNNAVNNQWEYPLKKRTINETWIIKIKWVSIKYNTSDTSYKKARLSSLNTMPLDLHYYKENQPKNDPFYTISDNSIFIFPIPDDTIVNWLLLYWISDPIDLTLSTDEQNIKIPLEYHYLLSLWMKRYFFASRYMLNEKNDAIAELNMEKQKMLKQLWLRQISPLQVTEPILSNLY